jgi:hypothetical protein
MCESFFSKAIALRLLRNKVLRPWCEIFYLPKAFGVIRILTKTTHLKPNGNSGDPTAGGIGILLVLGAAYGGKKVHDLMRSNAY